MPEIQTRSPLRARVLAAMGSLLIVMSLGAPVTAVAAVPTITSVLPNSGPALATDTVRVTITGTDFPPTESVMVTFDGSNGFGHGTATSLTAYPPSHVAGAVDVTVRNLVTLESVTLHNGFTYVGDATKLAFTPSPGGGAPGVAWVVQPWVTVEDAAGNPVTDSTASIALTITTPGGATLACIPGSNTMNAVAGVATFAGCAIDKVGTYTLTAKSASLSDGTSNTFDITTGPLPTPSGGPTPAPTAPTPWPSSPPRPVPTPGPSPYIPPGAAVSSPAPSAPGSPLKIGDPYGGGIVAYILQPGDPGYVAGDTRGIIAATLDQSAGIPWALLAYQQTAVPLGTGTALGTGSANTDNIIAQNSPGIGYAAGVARAYRGGGYADWSLPSKDELNKLYANKAAIGSLTAPFYWSSSGAPKSIAGTTDGNTAWAQATADGAQSAYYKFFTLAVRAVRSFSVLSDKDITSFSFTGLSRPAVSVIDHGAHTIAVNVLLGTDLTALVATFTTTGTSVKVGTTAQMSGTTSNDFTMPVAYTVTAADGSTQDYVVTVTPGLVIGDHYGGGIVGYILQPGDPGHVAGETKGLVVSESNLGSNLGTIESWMPWALSAYQSTPVTGGTGTALGTGSANTDRIIAQNGAGAGTGYAAGLARAYRGGGFTDWYLPSRDELTDVALNRAAITAGADIWPGTAWSSTQSSPGSAWVVGVLTGGTHTGPVSAWKGGNGDARAVRSFAVTSAKAITAFTFTGLSRPAVSVIDQGAHTIAVNVPLGTDVGALAATFATTGMSVSVGTTVQASGTTPNDFTTPVTYTVTAGDGSTQDYTVTVTPGLGIGDAYGGGIVAYILAPGDPGYVAGETKGIIAATADQAAAISWALPAYQTIAVPQGTGTALGTGSANTDRIIAQNSSGIGYAAGVARAHRGGGFTDWYLPSKDELSKLYANRAAIGGLTSPFYWSSSGAPTSIAYTTDGNTAWSHAFVAGALAAAGTQTAYFKLFTLAVRAVRAFSVGSDKAISALSFAGLSRPAVGVIDPTAHTIAVNVPLGTNVSALVATFAASGTSVSVGTAVQVNGTTPNDFTTPVTYTVTAADHSTQDYVVTVTSGLGIGDAYQGGIVAYILAPGDPGYVAGETRGLIAATADQSAATPWALPAYQTTAVPGGTGTILGTGSVNTDSINAQNGGGTGYAAGVAAACRGGGYADWYLPSKDELNKLYANKAAIGGLTASLYWSSSQAPKTIAGTTDGNTASAQAFVAGAQAPLYKSLTLAVRAVRAFPAGSKSITSFTFAGLRRAAAAIDQGGYTIAVNVPLGTDLAALAATFTATGTSVKVNTAAQVSGTTPNDFRTPVTYTVTAADGSTQNYVVTVTPTLVIGDPYGGGIVAYFLQPGDPGYEPGKTHGLIAATTSQWLGIGIPWSMPEFQTDVIPGGTGTAIGTGSANTDNIVAQNGAGTGYAVGLARAYRGGGFTDWYLPSKDELNKLYLNEAAIGGFGEWESYWSSSEDGEMVAWLQHFGEGSQEVYFKSNQVISIRPVRSFTVTSAKAITAFSFGGLSRSAIGVIDPTAHTIAVSVPLGTAVGALVATFATTGMSVSVGAAVQASGTTRNDFTKPVTYTVIAGDGSTVTYTVTVTPGLGIGDAYGGGIVAYILAPGDPGYVAGETKGIIAATADQSAATPWALAASQSTAVTGGTGTALGTGSANTDRIIAQNGAGTGYAAGVARAYRGGGYADWYLPSKDELSKLYLNKAAIGGLTSYFYWSSSGAPTSIAYTTDGNTAWSQTFVAGALAAAGTQIAYFKNFTLAVRAVRAFTQ